MAVKIRLRRTGAKRRPHYRLVVADSHAPRSGKYIELLGTYNPETKETKVNKELAIEWLNKGAQPTKTAKNLLSQEHVISEWKNEVEANKSQLAERKAARKAAKAEKLAQARLDNEAKQAADAASEDSQDEE